MQRKTQRPVQVEITAATHEALESWIHAGLRSDDHLFPSRLHGSLHVGTQQYARILHGWVDDIGLDSSAYGTHSMRRSNASMIHMKTTHLRAVQILIDHNKLESTVRYLGIVTEQLDVELRRQPPSCAEPTGFPRQRWFGQSGSVPS